MECQLIKKYANVNIKIKKKLNKYFIFYTILYEKCLQEKFLIL